jgi:hypothetical protein
MPVNKFGMIRVVASIYDNGFAFAKTEQRPRELAVTERGGMI